jgi:hypothetical protein
MNLARRTFLHLAAGAAALPAVSRGARAQAYPTRPITIILPFAVGGATDVIALLLAERIRQSLGQPVIVENESTAKLSASPIVISSGFDHAPDHQDHVPDNRNPQGVVANKRNVHEFRHDRKHHQRQRKPECPFGRRMHFHSFLSNESPPSPANQFDAG